MSPFQKVGVVGAGTMGSGIAQKIAQENIPVVLIDTKQELVDKGLSNIKNLLQEGVEKKLFRPEKTQQILSNLQGTTDINALKDADLVIEAIFEDEKVKKDLFMNLDNVCSDKTILASNTSSFSISKLASDIKRGERFVGLHYFYHPAKNRLLEIIPGKATSEETMDKAIEFADVTGKTAILVKDAPGFAVNRFFVPWLNESVRLLEEGVANIATIDEAAKSAFKIGMGPFQLMNVTGIPIAYHSAGTLGKEFGGFYAPAQKLKEQFENKNQWDLAGEVDESKMAAVKERLLGVVFFVAGQLVDDNVAVLEDIDRGAKIGLRWARGPFELMNKIGLDKAVQMVEGIVKKYGVKMPGVLELQHKSKKPWAFRLVDLSIKDNVATISINRPEVMNALNEEVVRQLDEAFTRAENEPQVKAIVLAGKGKAFVAGADIGFFIKNIEKKSVDKIVNFTQRGHDLLLRIDKCAKTVIAKLDGLALGGGAELALAADIRLMTERGSFGLPETGIGIYPGLGGTQRLPRLIGQALAKYLIFTGEILPAKQAQEFGLVEYVKSSGLNERIKEMVAQKDPKSNYLQQTIIYPAEMEKIKSIFSDTRIKDLFSGALLKSTDPLEAKIAKKVSYKAPLGIKLANKVIDEGSKLSLEEGIKVEQNHMGEVFSTEDAHEGLTSIMQKRRPSFRGA